MITISLRPVGRYWGTISFASTLYLCPILDLLLTDIPTKLQSELRLGLQEALVNAAKHGNNLDPGKLVVVRFSLVDNQYWWIISDQGSGFTPWNPLVSPISIYHQTKQKVDEVCPYCTRFLIK